MSTTMHLVPAAADQVLPPLEAIARLGLAALAGAAIGLNRERRHGLAGLRTHMIVALAAAAAVIFVTDAGLDDASRSRVVQGILQGIGFLGAGTIVQMSSKGEVRGLTTAATVWLVAVLGIGAALAPMWLPVTATTMALMVLGPVAVIERRMQRKARDKTGEPSPPDNGL